PDEEIKTGEAEERRGGHGVAEDGEAVLRPRDAAPRRVEVAPGTGAPRRPGGDEERGRHEHQEGPGGDVAHPRSPEDGADRLRRGPRNAATARAAAMMARPRAMPTVKLRPARSGLAMTSGAPAERTTKSAESPTSARVNDQARPLRAGGIFTVGM